MEAEFVQQPPIAPSLKQPKKLDGQVARFPRERFMRFCDALKIQSRDYGLQQFKLLQSQLYILDELCKALEQGITTIMILKSRQLGASTFFLALDLFWAFEHAGLSGIFATHDEASRDLFRNMVGLFLQGLPKRFKKDDINHNAKMLVFDNTSFFRYLVAGQRQNTNKLGRSGGCNFLHATEVAFWGSISDIQSLTQTFSEIYPHRLFIFESTANGFNHYSEMWEVAKQSKAQYTIFVSWWRDERNEFGEHDARYKMYMPRGVKTPLSPLEKKRVADVKKLYGYQVNAGQIAWYRYHLENKCQGDQSMMDQEQPWTEYDAFVATGSVFLTNQALTDQMREARTAMCMPMRFNLTHKFEETTVSGIRNIHHADLKVWEAPSKFGRYVIGADPAYGSSDSGDNGVIHVARCYSDRLVQVAEYADFSPATYQFAWVLAYLAGLYRGASGALVNLEVTGPGTSVLDEIKRLRANRAPVIGADGGMTDVLHHMREFLYQRSDSIGGVPSAYHWKTTGETKKWLMNTFKDQVELTNFKIRSIACIDEMQSLVIKEGNIEASGRKHDDRVVAAGLACWAWKKWIERECRVRGLTYAKSLEIEKNGGEDRVDALVQRFMREKNISLHDTLEKEKA